MRIRDMIEDLEEVLKEDDSVQDYEIAVASYDEEDPDEINVFYIGAFHTDENKQFYLVPLGAEKCYNLESQTVTAGRLLASLKALGEEALSYKVFVWAQVGEMKDGSVAAINKPLWATGIHDEAELVYFQFGEQR